MMATKSQEPEVAAFIKIKKKKKYLTIQQMARKHFEFRSYSNV